jgi:hypothetical protein
LTTIEFNKAVEPIYRYRARFLGITQDELGSSYWEFELIDGELAGHQCSFPTDDDGPFKLTDRPCPAAIAGRRIGSGEVIDFSQYIGRTYLVSLCSRHPNYVMRVDPIEPMSNPTELLESIERAKANGDLEWRN